jgi:hypothetical protein
MNKIFMEVVDGHLGCRDCYRILPVSDFHLNRARKCGYTMYCKMCSKVRTNAWRQTNPEKNRASMNAWRKKNVARVAEYDRQHHLKHKYGLTQDEYNTMLTAQDGKCAACGSDNTGNKRYRRLPVDHCHATGMVRKLLCNSCNNALGQVNDSVDRLLALAAYLMQFQNVLSLGDESRQL